MIRNLKTLGLALFAVLALTAVGASAASASAFSADEYPVTVEGEQTNTHTFTVQAGTTHCSVAKFHGTAGAESSTLTITPTYTGCTLTPLGSATVKMNGCDYMFHSGAATGNPDEFNSSVDIVCSGSNVIEVVVPFICTVKVGPQTGLSNTVLKSNTSPATVTATASVSGIAYSQSGSFCTNGSFSNGTYNGTVAMSGTNEAGESNGIYVK